MHKKPRETIGEAYRLGWRIRVRCAFPKREAMKSIRESTGSAELDLATLVWTRGVEGSAFRGWGAV